VQLPHFGVIQHKGYISQLVGIDIEVIVRNETRDELAVEVIVRGVDGTDTPVRVVGTVQT